VRTFPTVSIALTLVLLSVTAALTATNVAEVIQKGRAFSTGGVQIPKGGIVRFINDDLFLHQVYVETPSFNFESDEQEPGTNVEVQFPKPGLFEVRCHIHPKMLLQVEVK